MFRIALLISIFFITSFSYANVWHGQKNWEKSDLKDYSNWISSEVSADIFSDPESPYYGIKTDCADVLYSLMIIYSFENSLYFKVRLKDNEYIDNNTPKFNNFSEGKDRLFAFIHYISKQSSTYTLSSYNSLALAINEISPGDIYITSFVTKGIPTNHAYLIKNLIPTGHFELYSSTTPAKVRKLNIRKGYPLHVIKDAPWGFKRMIPYPLIDELKKEVSVYNNEQYQILKEEKDYFGFISKMIQTTPDSFDNNINLQFDNICDMLTSRIPEVSEASGKNRCFSASEFDLYSTPTRDENIKIAFNRLLTGWKKIRNADLQISTQNVVSLNFLIGSDKSNESRDILTNRCPLRITDKVLNLRDFFYLQYLGRVSSNPNDPELTRWGLSNEKSSCKRP